MTWYIWAMVLGPALGLFAAMAGTDEKEKGAEKGGWFLMFLVWLLICSQVYQQNKIFTLETDLDNFSHTFESLKIFSTAPEPLTLTEDDMADLARHLPQGESHEHR